MAQRGDWRDEDGTPMCAMCRNIRNTVDVHWACNWCKRIHRILKQDDSKPRFPVKVEPLRKMLSKGVIPCEIRVIHNGFGDDPQTWEPASIIEVSEHGDMVLISHKKIHYWYPINPQCNLSWRLKI